MTERLKKALASARETRACMIGETVLKEVPALFREQFSGAKAVIVADTTTFDVAGRTVRDALKAAGLSAGTPYVFSAAGLFAEMSHVDRLTSALQAHNTVPVAVGSGTINDLTKLAAHRCGRPLYVRGNGGLDGWICGVRRVHYVFRLQADVHLSRAPRPCGRSRCVLQSAFRDDRFGICRSHGEGRLRGGLDFG